MSQFLTVFKKEFMESWRNFSWVWVPIVFILLSIMDPLTYYYLPKIMDAVGGVPEGMAFEIPEIPAPDAVMLALVQISSIGVLIVVLLTMGTIAGERKTGIAELVLVKPVNHVTYILAKWFAKFVLFFIAFTIGMLLNWYYVNLLFGDVGFTELIYLLLFYALWIMFVISLTIFFSTIFKGPGPVAGVTIGTLLSMSVVNGLVNHWLPWFPNQLSTYINEMLYNQSVSTELWGTAGITVGLSAILLICSFIIFKNKKVL
ncbi:MAG: ABC transporter permease [Amphibacillus sp.]|nr:ABC transporter permease [Amphibacillus sp.]